MEDKRKDPDSTGYIHGYDQRHRDFLPVRTARREADFLIPHLR